MTEADAARYFDTHFHYLSRGIGAGSCVYAISYKGERITAGDTFALWEKFWSRVQQEEERSG